VQQCSLAWLHCQTETNRRVPHPDAHSSQYRCKGLWTCRSTMAKNKTWTGNSK